jgi:tight adherence protein B
MAGLSLGRARLGCVRCSADDRCADDRCAEEGPPAAEGAAAVTGLAAACSAAAVWCWFGGLRRAVGSRRLGAAASPAAAAPRGIRRERARPRARVRRGLEVAELADALAAELTAGADWSTGLARASGGCTGELADRLAAVVDVGRELPRVARLPGAEGLLALRAAEQLSTGCGAPAAALVGRIAEALRAEAHAQRAVEIELAPARATTRLLAGLPLVGLLMGMALGADPLRVLALTGPGRGCLLLALLLEGGGLLWCRAIRRSALTP